MERNEMKTNRVPVLVISTTNTSGSHRTIYPVGTKALALVHDVDPATNTPTYAEGVYVEMVSEDQADCVRRAGKLDFSDTDEFQTWLSGEEPATVTVKNTTRNAIQRKLSVSAALTLFYHGSGDQRGMELAATLESEAHALWRAEGMEDVPTYVLTVLTA